MDQALLDLYCTPITCNHYALKTKIYVSALQTAYQQLQKLQPINSAA